jgi:hypothetical protein
MGAWVQYKVEGKADSGSSAKKLSVYRGSVVFTGLNQYGAVRIFIRDWLPGVMKHVGYVGTRARGQSKLSKTSLYLARRLEQREVHSVAFGLYFPIRV